MYTTLGCVPWVAMLGYVGVKLGGNWEKIKPYLHYADYVVVVVLVLLVVSAVVRWRRRRGSDTDAQRGAADATPGPESGA